MFTNKAVFVVIVVICSITQMGSSVPILGYQTDFEDNSRLQGKTKPIFVFCDEIGNHLNCMMYCKSMGLKHGHCGGDFTCNCF